MNHATAHDPYEYRVMCLWTPEQKQYADSTEFGDAVWATLTILYLRRDLAIWYWYYSLDDYVKRRVSECTLAH